MHIVIIGGGITGLSAANRLTELSSERRLPLEITLLESSNRLGGTISTKNTGGFLIEEGPDSFITTKPWALDLCHRLGLESQLIQTSDENRRTFVVQSGKLIPLPEGFLMMAPTRLMPFLKSPLFSWRGKLRMALDLFLPSASKRSDESLASFVIRRLGREALERAAQPMISGIYTSDPEKLSLRATMPRFLEMEEKHGSVIKAMRREQRETVHPEHSRRVPHERTEQGKSKDSGARYSLFVSFKDGMQTLVNALLARLPEGSVKLNQSVKSIEIAKKGWSVFTDNSKLLHADSIIIATPSYLAAKLIEGFDSSFAEYLSKIQYVSSAVISLAYKIEDISHSLDGFGFVVPMIEKRPMIACSFSSVKFQGRAPEGFALFRCFIGGGIKPDAYEWDDSTMIETAHRELTELLRLKAKPLFALTHRHPKSMPQYEVGHLDLVDRIREKVSKHLGLALAGNTYGGVGIPDCVHSGQTAAESVFNAINKQGRPQDRP